MFLKLQNPNTTQSDEINYDRRGFLRNAVATIAGAELSRFGFADAQSSNTKKEEPMPETSDKKSIRPFQVNFPESELTELRRRVNATRWPEQETVKDDTQGVQFKTIQALAKH